MKITVHPSIEADRLAVLKAQAPGAEWVNAAEATEARRRCRGPTPSWGRSLPRSSRGRTRCDGSRRSRPAWSITCSRNWSTHPCTLTNMRGLFGDVIADQVMGYVLCFARNLHIYVAAAGRAAVRADRRGGGTGELRGGAGDGQRDGPGDDLPARAHSRGRRLRGASARRSRGGRRPSGWPIRGVDRRPGRTGRLRRGSRRSGAGTAGGPAGLERLRRRSPRRTRPRRPDCSTPRRSPR